MPSTITDRLSGLTTSVAVKAPCKVAATANITLSGTQTISSVAVVEGDRVVATAQTSSVDNGIWIVGSGVWARAKDFNGARDVVDGTLVLVGTTAANSQFWLAYGNTDPILPGTSQITFEQVDYQELALRSDLASTSDASLGAGMVGRGAQVVGSIAALRLLLKTVASRHAFVTGYYAQGDGGGGEYWYDSTDITSADNGGTIIVGADGGRWKLASTHGWVSVKQFGARGNYTGGSIAGQNDTAAIQAALTWAASNIDSVTYGSYSPSIGTGVVYFPQGSYGVNAALTVPNKICILGEGQSEYTFGSRLTQTLNNTNLFQVTAGAGSTSFSVEKMILRSNAGTGTGHLVHMVRSGGGTVNSQRYTDCTFAQPQAMALKLAGDDIVIKNCLFDVSNESGDFIELGTATMTATQVRVEGCDFFNADNSCIKLTNALGLVISGNFMSQPNSATRTPYFIDGQSATPVAAQDITVVGNTIRGPRTFVGIAGAVNLTVSGNTVAQGGIGGGETFHMMQFGGTCINVAITGNTFRGAFDASNFYNDFNCTSITGIIASNSFQNDGGPGDALACTKFTGRIASNYYAGFSGQQMGEKRATAGGPINPGSIAAGGTFGYAFTVQGATFGDTANVGTISNAWFAQTGIDVRAFINGANTGRIEYRNVTAGSISVPAHNVWTEVTR